MDIKHDSENQTFRVSVNGHTGYVSYQIKNGYLDILHTVIPSQIGGQGIASELVKAAYDYAIENKLQPAATCSYAITWLQRHPEYNLNNKYFTDTKKGRK